MGREKVISELQSALEWCEPEDNPNGSVAVKLWAVRGAVELLKEQEPVKPRYEDFFGNRVARCGKCNGYIVRYKYCPGCGKEVKWE